MRIHLQDDTLKLRREGIFLCLDGVFWTETVAKGERSDLLENLYEFFEMQCRNFDIPFRMGLLSYDQIIDDISEIEEISEHLTNRGKFITPLIESIFSQFNDQEYDLIIINSGEIYDYEDWDSHLNSKFNKIQILDADMLVEKIFEDIENQILNIMDFEVGLVGIKTKIENGIIYDFPNEFKVKIEEPYYIICGNFKESQMDIKLKVYGKEDYSLLEIDANGTYEPISIKNSLFETSILWRKLDENELGVFKSFLDQDLDEYNCPLCNEEHPFTKAFICERTQGHGVFTSGRIIFNSVDEKREYNSKYILFLDSDDVVYWKSFEKSVNPVNNDSCFTYDGKNAFYIDDNLNVSSMMKTHQNVYNYSNLYLIEIGD